MVYGPLPPRRLPQQDPVKVRLLADRWWRDSQAMSNWATIAKECYDMFEGRQWTQDQIAKLAKQGRPALTFNKIAPLVRLIIGYMRNNRTDIRYLPASEGPATEENAEVLSRVAKQISEMSQLPWVDSETFLDGIVTGRGFWDTRLDFQDNDLGEARIKSLDPFSTYVDCECEEYDIGRYAKRMTVTKWASLDEVEMCYGPQAAAMIRPFIGSTSNAATWSGFPFLDTQGQEITPVRTFAETDDPTMAPFQDFFHTELIDQTRKVVRILDQQHAVVRWGPVFIDLETGDKVPVPINWGRVEIEKALYHAQQIGNPVVVDTRPIRQIRWTTLIGDVIVHDDWSPYDTYTITGYFPYFRRGKTGGMVSDLLDPQREVNKRRSSEIDIVTRSANSGWIAHEDSISPTEEANWKANSAKPGFFGKWKGEPGMKPERITPNPPPTAMEKLEEKGRNDLREISGINESALGELDRVQSGRAIEARQRQAVIAVQMYMDNFSRSKELIGRRIMELVQRHYTQERVFRIVGEDGNLSQFIINQAVTDPVTGQVTTRLNDITLGKYSVAVDETPLSASYANAQFEEMMALIEKMGPLGQVLLQTRPDLVVDLSSLPRKKEWANALRMAAGAQPGLVGPDGQPLPPSGGPAPGGPAPGGAPSLVQAATPGGNVIPMSPAGTLGR